MMPRLILTLGLLQLGAWAQLQFFHFDGTTDTPVTGLYDAGTAATCDKLVVRFHVRNVTTQDISVLINVAGTGFTFAVNGLNPSKIAAQQQLEFDVSFTPATTAAYSATITANSLSASIRATGIAAPCLSFGQTQLSAGAAADFGQVEWGSSLQKTFTLTNPSNTTLTVPVPKLSGPAFQGPSGISAPLQLTAGASTSFQIAFAPQAAGPASGVLSIDQRTFNLKGLATDPPLPKGGIVLSSQAAASGQQIKVSIALASPSKVAGNGTLTLQFQPAPGLTDDAAVQFLSGAKRSATVTIAAGDSIAKVGGQPDFAFQTGTTSGSILFTLTLPNSSDQLTLPIAPALVNLSTASGVRRIDAMDVNLAGFDNTHSVSQLGFTFYDASGQAIQPGLIRTDADAAVKFKNYFTANAAFGGMFTALVTFPVTGDTSKIASVDVQVSNAAGMTTSRRINF
jgi:hypothetical protein